MGRISGGFRIQKQRSILRDSFRSWQHGPRVWEQRKTSLLAVLRDTYESLELAVSIVSSYAPLQLFFQDRFSKKSQKKPFPLRKMPEACCSLASSCQHNSNISPAPDSCGKMRDEREERSSDDSPWPKNDASGQEIWQWIPLYFGHSKSPCLQHPIADREQSACTGTSRPVAPRKCT